MTRRWTTHALVVGAACLALGTTGLSGAAQAAPGAAPYAATAAIPPATRQTAADGLVGTVTSQRLYDSRTTKALAPGEERTVCDTLLSVPDDAGTSLVVNLTAVSPTAAGFLTAWPSGNDAPPPVSNLNFTAGTVTSNLALVRLGTVGCMTLRNSSSGSTQVVVDVQGYLTAGPASAPGGTQTIYASRLLDTRTTRVAIPAKGSIDVQVAGRGGIPGTSVGAAWLNLTVTGNAAPGFLAAYPAGTDPRPTTSSVNFAGAETRAALTLAKIGTNGRVTVYNGSAKPAHLVVDAFAWVKGGDASTTLAGTTSVLPRRVLDTRNTGSKVGPRDGRGIEVPSGAPANAPGLLVAVTATNAGAAGFLSVDAGFGTSVVNYTPGRATTNLVLTRTGTQLQVLNGSRSTAVDVVVDVVGWPNPERAVAGRVVDSEGAGVAGASVGHGTSLSPSFGRSAPDGGYASTLPASTTSVIPCAVALKNGFVDRSYARGCHPSATNPPSLPIGFGERLVGADIVLEHAGALGGTATDSEGAALTGGTVRVWRTGDSRPYATSVSNGLWSIPAVAVGSYYVELTGPSSPTAAPYGLASEWYPDVQVGPQTSAATIGAAGATALAVTAGATTPLALVAEKASLLAGTFGSADGTTPLPSTAQIVLHRGNGSKVVGLTPASTATRPWSYPVRPGAVKVCGYPAPGQPETCWPDGATVEETAPVTVAPGERREGIDVRLP
ncbi:hypothetical protein [Pedococcus sp. 5OH_020]|uniref:hypothetical protein n=1 Tax=Pedococcus sp. 5OH_020 TaxID=2989814 RepID=UPI0022EA0EAB|nr:hypothetical protein [Pedococcus sp. 5OH_020]